MLISLKNGKDSSSHHLDQVNYEEDSARFLYDAYIEEYRIVYKIILARIDIQDRTENYLFLIISAILSIIPISVRLLKPIQEFSADYPIIYIALAVISLLFPFKFLQQNIFEKNLTDYLQYVLGRKINVLVEGMPKSSQTTQSTFVWEKRNLDPSLHGTFQHHDYKARVNITSKMIIGVGGFFRHLFVCIPSTLFFLFFLSEKGSVVFWQAWTLPERIVTFFFAILVLVYIIGLGSSLRNLKLEDQK
jgi:hypothetical protein